MWVVRATGYRRQSLGPSQSENVTLTPIDTLWSLKGTHKVKWRVGKDVPIYAYQAMLYTAFVRRLRKLVRK